MPQYYMLQLRKYFQNKFFIAFKKTYMRDAHRITCPQIHLGPRTKGTRIVETRASPLVLMLGPQKWPQICTGSS